MKARRSVLRGFTLIELMVTISIAAVLLAVAVPSFVAYQRNSELTSVTNSLVAAIGAARGEAMKRGRDAYLVPANNGSDWSAGWVVFVDVDRSQDFDAAKDITVLSQRALVSYMAATGSGSATGTTPYIMFDASGYSKTKAGGFEGRTLSIARNDVSGTALTEQTRRVVIAATGRVRSCRPASDSTCTASATQ